MKNHNYRIEFVSDKSAAEVYSAINKVRGWWSEDFNGSSEKLGDEFEVFFEDIHFSRHRVVEMIPGEKVVWLVTDSHLSFLKNPKEWIGTKNIFEITELNNVSEDKRTKITFTHEGLVPGIECYQNCSNGWNYYLQQSLAPILNGGRANPNKKLRSVKKNELL
ncbi:SRPBCC domain-containing protein [Pollutibacter soli]|uniref:SRPBCC family protein n=1 Tax=Pollutibacter soli TaxID=3034157 RepID=UPI0030136BDD